MQFETYKKIRIKFLKLYFRFYHRLEVVGLKNIPEGPALIVPNHSGGLDLDILAMSYCCHPSREIQVLIVENYHFKTSMFGKYYLMGGIPL